MSQCTAKSKQTGQRCKRHTAPDRTVCYFHGGKIPRGLALPQTKDGRYSKSFTGRLLATYEVAKNDPEILSLIEEIAGVDSLSSELIAQLRDGVSLRAAYDAFMSFKAANIRKDGPGSIRALAELERVLTDAVANEDTEARIFSAWELRRKLTESERKRRVEMHDMVSSDQAALMVRSLVSAVRDHVHDAAALSAIADALDRLAVARPE